MRINSVYVHVPFCQTRCGYCDFNTYTAVELAGARRSDYAGLILLEIARSSPGLFGPLESVFFGGGTPTLLPTEDLDQILRALEQSFGFSPEAEISVEANPDSLGPGYMERLVYAGFNRLSLGMQSGVSDVLKVLERSHRPEILPRIAEWARDLELEFSVDLIYGSPTETLEQWRVTLEAALALEPGHISAYSLIVEPGTRLHRRIARGQTPAPDPDLQARMYELADARLLSAGYTWYEISNFARSPSQYCLHNLGYWRSLNWRGYGPGAHSHLEGRRFWNIKHPVAYASRLRSGDLPIAGEEILDPEAKRLEELMLGLRLREGMSLTRLGNPQTVEECVESGLLETQADRARLTLRGRLLANTVTAKFS